MAPNEPVAEINYVEPEGMPDECPTCAQESEACQAGLWEKLWTPAHHMHFMLSGSCTLWPPCGTELRTRSPDRCSGAPLPVLGKRPEHLRELILSEHSHEALSIKEHYGVPGIAMRGSRVAWWAQPGQLLLAREHEHARRVEGVVRRVGYTKKDAMSTSRGTCRQCEQDVFWGDTDSGKRVPLEPATMQESAREGFFVGSVHWDHCPKLRPQEKRRRRDRARQGEKE
jgi:hypothetical protein